MSGHRVVRWNFQRGDGTSPRRYAFSSDPRTIRDIAAAFEMAWDRAIPHAEQKTDQKAAGAAALRDQIPGFAASSRRWVTRPAAGRTRLALTALR